ncbi:probable low-specificity L-threonine aldolase 2 isoform X2 [Homarus americanus]|uniref:probable low-specificity L-threonine aldolase 2 isoform X2 n=1 Tax=Homarus americanus TaxID=6706 RepID=UPI001C443F19|nr:probable low-specificity L-threonine aldolase 2 isoform X2 [Homarus americanus]
MTRVINLWSDTVTQPSQAMMDAMMRAPQGDNHRGKDTSINELEKRVAALLGKEAALFVPTGTMGNLICVMTHARTRDSEVILGHRSHIHLMEQGGIAQIGGVHHRVVTNLADGTFSLEELQQMVRTNSIHFPISALVCVENTMDGLVLPLKWLDQLGVVCKELGLPIHMDGARLFHASTALSLPPHRIVRDCTSVSLSISKGLGCPVGCLIVGSRECIRDATRIRRVLGGFMSQPGVLAACGLYALDHLLPLLPRDHHHAKIIAQGEGGGGGQYW